MSYRVLARLCAAFGLIAGAALCGCGKSTTSSDGGGGGGDKGGGDALDLEAAKKKSVENLAYMGIAFHNHASANGGEKFPSPGLPPGIKKKETRFDLLFSWRFWLLPYLKHEAPYDEGTRDPRATSLPENVRKTIVAEYQNPLIGGQSTKTNYRVFVGNGAAFEWGTALTFGDFRDGLSNTILVVESAEPIEWASLDDFQYDPKKPLPKLGIFPGGFHALMGDGAVIWIPDSTDEKTIRAMITRNGGEAVLPPGKPLNPPR